MKNFSTGAARSLTVSTRALALAAAVLAIPAQAAPAAASPNCSFRPNAPDQHVVVKRDTLWDISGKFLEHPWCWPDVWGMNRDEIRNPHWIYPGQIIYFDRAHGRLTLTRPGSTDPDAGLPPVTKLSPQIRTEELEREAIPAIPASAIEPFLTQPLVVEPRELEAAPRIAAAPETQVYLAEGNRFYVRGALHGAISFQVFRPGKKLVDPDTGKVIAHEAAYVGAAKLVKEAGPGVDVHTFVVTRSVQEMGIGDRLLPAPPMPVRNYVPHAPIAPVAGRVMAIASESNYAAQNQVVTVNRGALDGLDVGAVLQLYHLGKKIHDPGGPKGFLGIGKKTIRMPDEQYGELFIFRVFGHVSYGLVMQVTLPVQVGDVAKSPE
ncbi:LysM peptidoglycan-binding domain-containing protein [Massilia norwichensis]|uniref:LysM peptidoglycan-binding domain-containing protein n=1 Tax=Massilia norwichensis TaxID=1442366 RepID=A0ABT2ACL7_9BURK|nr:LysM peptidoglycan-binding domain-containing protein [Massilia norwichensis]MCS0591892.1 LysM peptidoglycan-binding domain-containing protein [Massilia norwichensis]